MSAQGLSRHHVRKGDLIRDRNGIYGDVLSASLLAALVAFEDGSVREIEQYDAWYAIEERAEKRRGRGPDIIGVANIRKELAELKSREREIEDEIEDLHTEADVIHMRIRDLQDELRLAEEEAAKRERLAREVAA